MRIFSKLRLIYITWSEQELEQIEKLVNEIGHGQWEKTVKELGTNRTI
jgi:hypothetical protein